MIIPVGTADSQQTPVGSAWKTASRESRCASCAGLFRWFRDREGRNWIRRSWADPPISSSSAVGHVVPRTELSECHLIYDSNPGDIMKRHRALLMLCLLSAALVARADDYPAPRSGTLMSKTFSSSLARDWRSSSCTITPGHTTERCERKGTQCRFDPARNRRLRAPIPDATFAGVLFGPGQLLDAPNTSSSA